MLFLPVGIAHPVLYVSCWYAGCCLVGPVCNGLYSQFHVSNPNFISCHNNLNCCISHSPLTVFWFLPSPQLPLTRWCPPGKSPSPCSNPPSQCPLWWKWTSSARPSTCWCPPLRMSWGKWAMWKSLSVVKTARQCRLRWARERFLWQDVMKKTSE